jgi:hypothetical protein
MTTRMTTIFYDFETSSREPLGQILSYSFIVVNDQYDVIDELTGIIAVNRTQLPDIDAILTNKLNIDDLNSHGKSDYETAGLIYHFLDTLIRKYGNCTLAGFNSNRFDLTFLRNLLIGYGYNPYFKGKLHNKDVLHFAQFLAFQYPEQFPWVRTEKEDTSYYSFKLEDLTTALGLLKDAQTHNARDDVILTIQLVQTLEKQCTASFISFEPTQWIHDPMFQGTLEVGKQKVRHYAKGDDSLHKFTYRYLVKVGMLGKAYLVIDLSHYEQFQGQEGCTDSDKLACVRYINPNKAFFIFEPLLEEERLFYTPLAESLLEDPYFQDFQKTPALYFERAKKDWDILYQIHEMGFERIDILRGYIQRLIDDPDTYDTSLKQLLSSQKSVKDRYLLTLFNRAYLNHHPSPNPAYLEKYMKPRYETGTMLRDTDQFTTIKESYERIQQLLSEKILPEQPLPEQASPEQDLLNLEALKRHIEKNTGTFILIQ